MACFDCLLSICLGSNCPKLLASLDAAKVEFGKAADKVPELRVGCCREAAVQ